MGTRSLPQMYRGRIERIDEATAARVEMTHDERPVGEQVRRAADRALSRFEQHKAAVPKLDAPTLDDILDPKSNSFGVMRFLMAFSVLVSHTFFLYYGLVSVEPLYGVTGYTLGQHGVQLFFFLSGVLVAQSLAKSRSLRDYAIARALRIFPALIVCVLLTALVIGAWLTTLDPASYYRDTGLITYIAKTISLSTGSATLPGLYEANTVPGVVNTPLWTLKYEVICYAILAGIGFAAIASGRPGIVVGAALSLWFAAMLTLRPDLQPGYGFGKVVLYFTLFFGAGVAAYFLRKAIKLSAVILAPLGVFAYLMIGTTFAEIAFALFLGYGMLWLATFEFGRWRAFANSTDMSYGVYIYHMPITQALLLLVPGINLVSLIMAATGLTMLAAFLSWELIERPALDLRHRFRTAKQPAEEVPAVEAQQTGAVTDADSYWEHVEPPVPGNRLRFAARTPATGLLTAEEKALLRDRIRNKTLQKVV